MKYVAITVEIVFLSASVFEATSTKLIFVSTSTKLLLISIKRIIVSISTKDIFVKTWTKDSLPKSVVTAIRLYHIAADFCVEPNNRDISVDLA